MKSTSIVCLSALWVASSFFARTTFPVVPPPDRSGARAHVVAPSRGVPREQWEYHVEDYPSDYPGPLGLQRWLNEHGAHGWEMCSGNAYLSRFTFKRASYRL